jgi:Rieske [2Fe-2S] domain
MNVLFTRMKQAPGASYHYIADRMSKSDVKSAKSLANGEGALVQTDGHKFAVYKDEAGQLHVMSPVCRHLNWNNLACFEDVFENFDALGMDDKIEGPDC